MSSAPRAQGVAPPPPVRPIGWADEPDDDDDDGWQDMPVVRSDNFTSDLDAIDDKKYHFRPPARLDSSNDATEHGTSNATGVHLELQADTKTTDSWREKAGIDDSEYTRLRLDEDNESEEVHMRTRYLFDEDKAMTPLSQMQATKELLTEGQRIAYVGLCQLIARRMVRDMGRGWEGTKEKMRQAKMWKGKGRPRDLPVVESANIWMIKIMARLYQHMELSREEQTMIESLAEHGVDFADLVPALMTTHTVKNPEYDPEAKRQADLQKLADAEEHEEEVEREAEAAAAAEKAKALEAIDEDDDEDPAPAYEEAIKSPPAHTPSPPSTASPSTAPEASASTSFMRPMPSLVDDDDDEPPQPQPQLPQPQRSRATSAASSVMRPMPSLFDDDDDGDGDIGSAMRSQQPTSPVDDGDGDLGSALRPSSNTPEIREPDTARKSADESRASGDRSRTPTEKGDDTTPTATPLATPQPSQVPLEDDFQAMPALPGVSTSLTSADETVTLDIRWTVLCDLFLVLIADSVYDSRSRAFLERVANALGFEWMDVVRFENRVTDALEIEESVSQLEQQEVIESRRKRGRTKRYALMGAAAAGGALVIGLSAGLLAPVIGAGLGAALGVVGVSGTSAFLTGVGGIAMITTTGVLTGANIAGRGMAKRTREVRTFILKPLHNNKRVSCYITVGGFMAGKADDVRLPFSVLDQVVGDVFSVLWEPEMMNELGNAIRIISNEVLSSVGQQILAATIAGVLMSALQWPVLLAKLGYLIDNPWSNAMDRARAAGLVLADVLIERHVGVRPTSLIGFSLGARVIFYALLELSRRQAYGIVQDVYLFGATLTASRQAWLDVGSVVGGRFVNGFSTNDWMLGYLLRAATGGLQTVAGLRPVETVPGLENVDVTDLISGHMAYRTQMPLLLARVGFPVTADYFDEPDDPDADPDVQERYVVHSDDEEEEVKQKKKILGIFPRRGNKKSRNNSGRNTPKSSRQSVDTAGTPSDKGKSSTEVDDDDDDDLPPREEAAEGAEKAGEPVNSKEAEEAAIKHIPKTAGFDFDAIGQVLGKDLDVDNIHNKADHDEAAPSSPPPLPTKVPERTESAPPPAAPSPTPSERAERPPSPPARSQSASIFAGGLPVEDDGDIAVTASKTNLDMPSWDRPAWSSSQAGSGTSPESGTTPPPVSQRRSPSVFGSGFNAWSSSSTTTTSSSGATGSFNERGLRAAPPARPHPPEFMANPFANPFASNGHDGDIGSDALGGLTRPDAAAGVGARERAPSTEARTKAEERLALENPW